MSDKVALARALQPAIRKARAVFDLSSDVDNDLFKIMSTVYEAGFRVGVTEGLRRELDAMRKGAVDG